jgi:hypothetical protein
MITLPRHLTPYNLHCRQIKAEVKSVKFSLCWTKYRIIKTYEGVVIRLHAFLTSALEGDKLLLYPREKNLRYPLDRKLDGPQSRCERGG